MDIFCYICGVNADVAQVLEDDLLTMYHERHSTPPVASVMHSFQLSSSDITYQRDLVLIGPFNKQDLPLEENADILDAVDPDMVRGLSGFEPGDQHDRGKIKHTASGRNYIVSNNYPFVHAACLRILQKELKGMYDEELEGKYKVPELVLWNVVRRGEDDGVCGIQGVIYDHALDMTQITTLVQPLANIHEAGAVAHPVAICAAMASGILPAGLMKDYWLGAGHMWLHVSPDKFPIQETIDSEFGITRFPIARRGASGLERLPRELLTMIVKIEAGPTFHSLAVLLGVSKTVRDLLWDDVEIIIKALIPDWLTPPEAPTSWLRYIHACSSSASMRNRFRIFGICQQIGDLGEGLDVFK